MFIAIDIGNTNTVIGIYKDEFLLKTLRIKSNPSTKQEIIIAKINSFIRNEKVKKEDITGIGISSVVPAITKLYLSAIKKHFSVKPMVVDAKMKLGIKIHYHNPNLLGVDRICSAIAGFIKYGGPLIIIDFGTATTYNVIASNGDFLGGAIAPGINTTIIALHSHTAKLPKVNLEIPTSPICKETVEGIQAGILYGAIDSVKGMTDRIKNELQLIEPKEVKIIATGGLSEFIANHLKVIQYIEPNLVLDGIRLICERFKNKRN